MPTLWLETTRPNRASRFKAAHKLLKRKTTMSAVSKVSTAVVLAWAASSGFASAKVFDSCGSIQTEFPTSLDAKKPCHLSRPKPYQPKQHLSQKLAQSQKLTQSKGAETVGSVAPEEKNQADELAVNTKQVTLNQGGIVRLAKNAEFVVGKSYKTAKVDDPNIVDIYPLTDKKVRLEPKGFGDTHVTFYDDSDGLIQAVHVQIEHPVAVTWPGPRTVGTTSFQCWATGCEFVGQTKYEEPAKVYHNYNFPMPPPAREYRQGTEN
jgi:hypothetical protein